jgi:eukaryotic-like serine/threonine-protein kinase
MLQPGWWFFGALFGEMKCVSGHAEAGLTLLLQTIGKVDTGTTDDNDPNLARLRAVAGLCALSLGDAAEAKKLAMQAHRAFTAQPDVSPYFKAPLVKLELALKAPRRAA